MRKRLPAAVRRQRYYAAILAEHKKEQAYVQAKADAFLAPHGDPVTIAREANRILRG